jgi:1-acyl-sn-glycerol-3-phosphate acyltransferase
LTAPTRRSRLLRAGLRLLLSRLLRLHVEGRQNIPRQGPCLLVFNQMSVVDTPLLSVIVPRADVTGLVARDYRRNAFYRAMVECGGGMWITRRSGDHAAMRAALAALARGWVVGISPEGRRSPHAALVEGRPGPALLARRSRAPIVPVAFVNTEHFAASLRRLRRPRIRVRVGEPFRLPAREGPRTRERLREDTDRIMCRIAALLPGRYRGAYAAHPFLSVEAEGARPRERSLP